MKYQCNNCNQEFDVEMQKNIALVFDNQGASNLHPFCPHCESLETQVCLEQERK